jgi:enoyl-CoA hydratase/carnithine racemase
MQNELTRIFDYASDSDEVRVLILTGSGHVFSAGADLKSRPDINVAGALPEHSRRTRECFHAIVECRRPVICALNGPALGAGLALAASCDILLASENASLGLPEIDVGLLGGARYAMRLFGHAMTRQMVFTGYRVPAAELLRLGVVLAMVPQEALMSSAMEMAQTIAQKSPLAVQLAKHALGAVAEMSLRDGYRFEQEMTALLSKSEDGKEARAAFLERRAPVYLR